MMKKSKALFYARRFLAGEPIPIFVAKADNYFINVAIDELIEARKRHVWRTKKGKLLRGKQR